MAGREDSAALRSRARRARRGVADGAGEDTRGVRLDRDVSGRADETVEDALEDVVEIVDNVEDALFAFGVASIVPIVEAGRRGREGGGKDTRGDALVGVLDALFVVVLIAFVAIVVVVLAVFVAAIKSVDVRGG